MERTNTLDARGLKIDEMVQVCLDAGLPKFRGKQLFQWIQQKAVGSWEEMTNISQPDKAKVRMNLELAPLKLLRQQASRDGTRKYLFALGDGESIECVLMDYRRDKNRDRHTVCVSTQVGCAVGCVFCATGLSGLRRNLSVAEITGQILEITRLLRQEDPSFQVTNVVFMGMGEPLHNYEGVLKALEILNHPEGQNIGMRRMTISTSGVAPRIRQLAEDNPQVGLAVSLHSADNARRSAMMPINRVYPLEELMSACSEYTGRTNRRITYEVALMAGQATIQEAEALVRLLRGQLAHVNLIPVNPVPETGMKRPAVQEILGFAQILEKAGVDVSVREEKGTDIEAACGQLRHRWESEGE